MRFGGPWDPLRMGSNPGPGLREDWASTQGNLLNCRDLRIPERIGSKTDYGLSGNWAPTRDNGPLVGRLSYRRPPLGGLL